MAIRQILGLILTCVSAFPQVVQIPDEQLEIAVREQLGKKIGDITVADMASIEILQAHIYSRANYPFDGVEPIRSLEGLQTAVNLRFLNLGGHVNYFHGGGFTLVPNIELDDFSPLSRLTNLYSLSLQANGLTNISLPAGFQSLRNLDLKYNQLADISFLHGMSHLTHLDLSYRGVGCAKPCWRRTPQTGIVPRRGGSKCR